jgi:hypothetical protein
MVIVPSRTISASMRAASGRVMAGSKQNCDKSLPRRASQSKQTLRRLLPTFLRRILPGGRFLGSFTRRMQ